MKKLSLLLLAICVSLAGWAASLNPYAYNLSSTWNEATQELTVRFNLNAHPNVEENNSGKGIQIFAIDPSDNNKQYYIYGVPGNIINEKIAANSLDYELTIPITGVTWNGADVLPAGKNLTWAVNVQGLNSKDQASPVVVNDNIANRPYSCHGIAVNNNQNSADFGSIYVTEASNGVADNNTWKWLVGKGKSLLKYTPRLEYSTSYQKSSPFSDRNTAACLLEPHRVRVSDDGRIFVSSYNRNTNTSQIDVWEFKNGTYTPLIYHKTDYGHRLIGMDVKGSGTNVTLLLCFLKETADLENGRDTKFRLYEYNVNTKTMTHVTDYANGNSETSIKAEDGTSISVNYQRGLTNIIKEKYYFYSDGLSSVTYGANKANNNFYWGADYFYNTAYTTRLVYYKRNDINNPSYFNKCEKGHYYGGAGMVSYIEQGTNRELIVMGRCQTGVGTDENKGRLQVYHNNNGTISATPIYSITTNSRTLINDVTIDPAYNLYAVSFTDGTTGSGTGRLIAIAMPYGGSTMTMAPSTNTDANRYFNVKPVPNILATDLRLEINNSNQYTFSFNTNTKPEEAEIRFYGSYDDMKNSLNVVNADNYNGTNANKPICVYKIPNDILKQGRIEVTLGGVGGTVDANGVITNDRIPAGELYWSVYVKTRESNAFAPTYRLEGVNDTQGAHRRYATVNNYPETDMFGSIIVADCPTVNSVNGPYNGLMIYGINPEGNSNDEQNDISNSVRYSHRASYLNSGVASASDKLNFPRRLVVAPDGRVFIADQGTTDVADYAGATSIVQHERGGVRLWDPKDPNKFTLFSHNKIGTSFGISLWEHSAANGGVKIYAANAYEEYLKHNSSNNYTDAQKNGIFGWNGFAEYTLNAHPNGSATWDKPDSVHYALGRGDASGNYSLVAMDKGVWMCQHREHTRKLKDDALQPLADNLDGVLISFFPYGATRNETWNSCTSNGVINYDNASKRTESADASDLTQKLTSPIQSTPGAGMAYRKIDGKDYLFVVNHDGNIAQILIEGWTGSGSTATPIIDASKVKILVTPEHTKGDREVTVVGGTAQWHTAFITTMSFDYAGNLVTTTGKSFGQAHDIIVYTMPYDRTNAREIQAPNSCRMIPERLAYLDMSAQELELVINNHKDHDGCAIELFRPLQEGMFNTICLPFTLDFATLPADHPLKDADVRAFTGVSLETIGGEKVLSLVFSDITNGGNKVMTANVPYLLQPVADIAGSMRFDTPVRLTSIAGNSVGYGFDTDNNITFKGVIPITPLEATYADGTPLKLLLVADNRLAALTSNTNMLGFRAYFQLAKPLPSGTAAKIVGKKPVATNTTIVVDGKKVNVEKYLREGRVYIRVGETLYSITGEVIER